MCNQPSPSDEIVPQRPPLAGPFKHVTIILTLELPDHPRFDTSLWPALIGLDDYAAAGAWGYLNQVIVTEGLGSSEGS